MQVNTNGYISLGSEGTDNSPDIPGTNRTVSPYGADINTSIAGTVRYTGFNSYHTTQMSSVSRFIRTTTGDYFYGTRMMVAEWDGVAKHLGSSVSLNCKINTSKSIYIAL